MPVDLTPDQISKLKDLGINIPNNSVPTPTPPAPADPTPPQPQSEPEIETPELIPVNPTTETPPPNDLSSKISNRKSNFVPLLSISGLTLISFGGIVFFKSKTTTTTNIPPNIQDPTSDLLTPTQVPKSIQHYLLASQQLFTQALQMQNVGANQDSPSSSPDQNQMVELLNQSILAATDAIKNFPDDHRGYYQRGKIYQSLADSRPELIDQAAHDFQIAYKRNPNSSEITHDLASLFAKKGDAQKAIAYLAQTVSLEPTKAQNFYDLAKIQQQAGLLPQALETYNRLIPLISDHNQKVQVESEKTALEKLVAQTSPAQEEKLNPPPIDNLQSPISLPDNPPTIQALADTGLIIAAPETTKKIEVENMTDSNSLSGTATLNANQKDMVVSNSNLTNNSQVYLAVTKGGKNQNLQVVSKSAGSFTVGLDTPITENIEFKWWIIN